MDAAGLMSTMKNKQVALNILVNFLSVAVSLVVSFMLTPYIVANIGKEAYSFVPISNNFVEYMMILTVAMTAVTSRFVTVSIHRENMEKANAYYSTSFFTNLGIALFVLILGLLLLIRIDHVIDIPPSIVSDIRLLFLFMFLMFFINVTTNVFSVPAFSINRIDITGFVTVISILTRLVVIIITFAFFPPRVYFVGLSILAYMIVQGSMNYHYARKLNPKLKISRSKFDISLAKELGMSGIWSSFNQLSSVLLTGLDLLIANVMLGASAAGLLAVAKTAPMALQLLVNVVPQAFHPHLMIQYAKESKETFIRELTYTLKISALLTAIPIAGFIVLAPVFFQRWVPTVADSQLVLLSVLTMGSMLASFSIMPLVYVFTITNKLKKASISVFLSGLSNLALVLILLKMTNLGLYAVAGVSSVLELIRYLIFVPLYASHCLHTKATVFYRTILRSVLYLGLLIATYSMIVSRFNLASWTQIGLMSLVLGLIGLGIGILAMLSYEERKRVWQIARSALNF